ncbi:MAG: hypothetical protein ACYDIA_01570 [Candidatus Humimicrobiaceae bacterium]
MSKILIVNSGKIMSQKSFDITIADLQGTGIVPMDSSKFDINRYREYEAALIENSKGFWNSKSG